MSDLVELDTVDFDFILGMDWLHACYTSVDCRTLVVQFQFPNNSVFEWKSSQQCLRVDSFHISKLVSKGFVNHLVQVNGL